MPRQLECRPPCEPALTASLHQALSGLHPDWQFFANALSIVIINLVLSGDNAVVIALAVRSLPRALRLRAMAAGAAVAVIILVAATSCAAWLLRIRFLKLAGGILILWMAVSLFRKSAPRGAAQTKLPGFWAAMWFIILADVTMSTDNILAVAAVARGDIVLLALGLGLSIPFVVVASAFIAGLMDRHAFLIYVGAAILGEVGAEMIVGDAFVMSILKPTELFRHCIEALGAIGVVVAGRLVANSGTR